MPAENETQKVEAVLREHALSYPGAHEDMPWGHRAMKVNDKTFLFMAVTGEKLKFSAKLPDSKDAALTLPFTEPTEYGLGKSGWVTANFEDASQVPVPVIKAWIDESYRAIAPKKLVSQLPERGTVVPGPASKPARPSKPAAAVQRVASRTARAGAATRKAAAPVKKAAKKVVAQVKSAAKKAAARVKSVAKKVAKKVPAAAKKAKAVASRKAATPARGKRAPAAAPKRARRS